MKKLLLFLIVSLFISSQSFSQLKVTIKLDSARVDAIGFRYAVLAIVPTGQTWRVGSSNIRIDFKTVPTGGLTVHPETQVVGGNPNLSNSANYNPMTTTSINGGTAISLNIGCKYSGPCYKFNPGTYSLGYIRFNRIDTTCCTTDTIRYGTGSSVVTDSMTALSYGTGWARINPPACVVVGTSNFTADIPTVFKLHDNYPNPFNPSTIIKYDIPKSSHVKITIYDMLGKEVGILVNQDKTAGFYEIQWDARNYSSGAYIYKMETDSYTEIKKMMLIK
jgi:hypothetical protein